MFMLGKKTPQNEKRTKFVQTFIMEAAVADTSTMIKIHSSNIVQHSPLLCS